MNWTKQRKLAIFLVIALLVSLMPAVSVFAAADYPVYLRNDQGWTDIRVYYEGQSGLSQDCQWPGIPMTKLKARDSGFDIYRFDVPATAASIVFTGKDAHGQEVQSVVITDIQFDACYYLDHDGDYSTYCFEDAILSGHVTSMNGDSCDYEVVEVVPPTCEEYGYSVMECIYCGNRREEWNLEPLGHTPKEGTAYTRQPSCEETGGEGYTCATCGEDVFEVEQIALGHTAKDDTYQTVDATCTQAGSVTAECAVCTKRFETSALEPLGHSLNDSGVCEACGVLPLVIRMQESYGDTWNGNGIEVRINGEESIFLTIDDNSRDKEWSIEYKESFHYDLYWQKGSYANECSFEVLLMGETLASCNGSDCSNLPNGELFLIIESRCEHSYTKGETVPVSCMQAGYTVYTCSACGMEIYQDVIPATGHSFSGGTCTTCGEAARIELSLQDQYTDGWNDAALELYINGTFYEAYTVKSGESSVVFTVDYDPLKQYEFYWVKGVYDSECSFSVSLCDEEAFSAAQGMCNDYANGELLYTIKSGCAHRCTATRIAPTCTEYGYDLNTCSLCGLVYKDHYIRPLSHAYGPKEIVPPTCMEEGYTRYTCGTCGHVRKTNFVDSPAHTCGTGDRCTVCQSRRLLSVEMSTPYGWYDNKLQVYANETLVTELTLRFDYEGEWSITYDPECEYVFKWKESYTGAELSFRILLDGEEVYVGDYQQMAYEDGQVVYALNTACTHEGTMTSKELAPTCDEEGVTVYSCTACGYGYLGSTTPATGHSYNMYGYCSVCYQDKPTEIPTLTASNISLLFEDEIFMNVYFKAENTSAVENYGIAIYPYQVDDPADAEAEAQYPGYEVNGEYFVVRTPGIAPKNMGENVFFAVYAELSDGSTVYSKIYYYSPLTYANSMLSKSSTASDMKALIVAMLNYGAAAQIHFDYKTDKLVNAGLTDEQKAMVTGYSSTMIADIVKCDAGKKNELFAQGNTAFSQRNPSVSFEGAFALNLYFGDPKAEIVGDVTFYVWRAEKYASVDTLEFENADAVSTCTFNGTYYVGTVENIAAKEVDETVYCAAVYTDADGNVCTSGVVAYSLGAYIKNQAGKTGTMANFAKATGVYSYYAKEQFLK